ncbi:hypothetical protein ACPFL9_19090 [Paenarthrobacter sp. NyZ202]|uniref:hypothetical protein n=1 Tax=Paenarthrobacter sp. NyZ202 TaxID=3402689 RepID=UPI003CF00A03
MLFILNNGGVPQSWFIDVLGILMLVSIAPVVVLIGWCASRERAERRAGYTTLRLGDRKLAQREPYMGRIIRLAGTDYLDRRHFAEILDATRAQAGKQKTS